MTLRHNLNVPYVRDEIKKLGQRYADRLEEHPNILVLRPPSSSMSLTTTMTGRSRYQSSESSEHLGNRDVYQTPQIYIGQYLSLCLPLLYDFS